MIILDRDGVINRLVVDPEQGTVNSPLHPSQVQLVPGAGEAITILNQAGHRVSIATNQPAAAKGTTTMANLEAVHARVLELVRAQGGLVTSSHICFHKSEDGCSCRKPATGLLEQALGGVSDRERRESWMVGDGITDVEAGAKLGLNTVYIGPRRSDHLHMLQERELNPTQFFSSLMDFAKWISER